MRKPAANESSASSARKLHVARDATAMAPRTFAPAAAHAVQQLRMESRRLKAEPLRRCGHRVDEIRRGGKVLAIRLPALRVHDRLLLEALPLEQIQPAIGARVDEQLEIRIERQLVVDV